MKFLKKNTAMLLTWLLIFSLFGTYSFASGDDELLLNSFGITIEFSDDHILTRSELANLAIQQTGTAVIENGRAVFVDVPEKSKDFALVNTVYINGLMTGYPDGTFKPHAQATVWDAAGTMLSLLGYNTILGKLNSVEVDGIVRQSKILSGIQDGPLTGAKLKRLFVNLLDANVVGLTAVNNGLEKYEVTDGTYMSENYGYISRKGRVNATDTASLPGVAPAGNKHITIAGERYFCDQPGLINYLGKDVRVILDEEESTVLSIIPKESDDEIIVPANKIVRYENYTLTYEDETNRQKIINIDMKSRIVVNGKNTEFDDNYFRISDGVIRFDKLPGERNHSLIVIETGIIAEVVQLVDGEFVIDNITNERFDFSDAKMEYINAGKLVSSSIITKGAFIMIKPDAVNVSEQGRVSANYNNLRKVIIETLPITTVEGTVTKINDEEIQVSDEVYSFSSFANRLISSGTIIAPQPSSIVTLYINAAGEVLYFKITNSNPNAAYGYLLGMNRKSTLSPIQAMIINENGEQELLRFASNAKVNNRKLNLDDLVADKYNEGNQSLFVDGVFRRQLVQYTKNSAGDISALYTAKDYASINLYNSDNTVSAAPNPTYNGTDYKGYDEQEFSLDYLSANLRYYNGFNQLFLLNSDTKVFTIPSKPEDYKKYKVDVGTTALDNEVSYSDIRFFDVNKDYEIGVVVIDYSTGGSSGSRSMTSTYVAGNEAYIITGKTKVFNSEDGTIEERLKASFYSLTARDFRDVTLNCDDVEMQNTMLNNTFSGVKWKELTEGDIIQVGYDGSGNIDRFRILSRASDLYGGLFKQIGTQTYSACIVIGKVVNAGNERVIVSYDPFGATNVTKLIQGGYPNPPAIFVYKDGKASPADKSDVRVEDVVFVRTGFGLIRELFIYR